MPDRYRSYAEIQQHFLENRDYHIEAVDRGGSILILSPHGGGIERGTSELVRAIAGSHFSYYNFEATMRLARDSQRMHLTSTRFDEPRLLEMVKGFQTALAIHGCVGDAPLIYAGGKDLTLRDRLIDSLKKKGYPVESENEQYAGASSLNICNRTATGQGVQIELSQGLRRLWFAQWDSRQGRKATTPLFQKFVSDIREILT